MLNIFLGEFLGTMLLIILGNGVVANVVFKKTIGTKSGFLTITIGWGLAVFMGVVLANTFETGGHLNPAVTTMVWVKGDIGYDQAFVYYASEMLGAIVGQIIIASFYFQHIKEINNQDAVLSMHSTTPTHKNTLSNLFSEFIGTVVLVTMAMILFTSFNNVDGSQEVTVKSIMGFVGPFSMGMVVLGIGISLGGTTGYAINPVRDLGPRIVHTLMPYPHKKSSNWQYSWVPVLGPILSGIVIGLFGRLM